MDEVAARECEASHEPSIVISKLARELGNGGCRRDHRAKRWVHVERVSVTLLSLHDSAPVHTLRQCERE